MKARIAEIVPGSIAEELGIAGGDFLIAVNGVTPLDMIEYGYITAEEVLDLEVETKDGRRLAFDIEKDLDDDLGMIFQDDTFDGQKRCRNKCIFCFVDQMPPRLRDTLYVKDDDYRLSFLYGNFITMTNLAAKDLARIKSMRISPLYISVHTMNGDLRQRMLGNTQAGEIERQMRELAQAGIEMHTQIVLCPGINDGSELNSTLEKLAAFWPDVGSVAVVPVGLTRFQSNPEMRGYQPAEAAAIVDLVSLFQAGFQEKMATNFVWLADEFYLLAGRPIPDDAHYEGYPQMENGVGLVRLLWQGFDDSEESIPTALAASRRVAIVTGVSARTVLLPLVDRFNQVINLQVELLSLSNEFFGPSVTVAGLLTGSDLLIALKDWRHQQTEKRPLVLIPSVMLKFGEDVFLDGVTVNDVQESLQIELVSVAPTAEDLIKNVIGAERQSDI